MATDLTKYRCRKCRQFLFDDRCVAPSHGALGPCGERSTLWYLNDENDDFLPSWIQKQINQGSWTKGKILCPKCKGRLGSYDFIAVNMCSCGESNTPNIQICKSRVDVSFDQALSNRISTTVLPRRQMNLNLMLDNDETPLYHERFMFADDVIIPSQESAAAVQDITTLSGTATAEDGRVTQDQVTFTNSHDLLLAGVSHFENDNRDIISQQQQTVTNRPSTDITVQPRTHRSIKRQSDPSMGNSNFTMQEKSTQTHESIESVQSCSHAQFRQSVGDTLTGTEFRELQQLCESFEQFDNHQDSVNEFNDLSNTMQTNQVAQTLLSAIPLVLRNDGNRDANDEDSHSVRQMSRRRRKNRLRQLRRRAKKRGRSLDGRSGYSVLQEIDQQRKTRILRQILRVMLRQPLLPCLLRCVF
ncbi:uncharacterized protein [Ptychodera flava]|uniref:uncharacterized protein n=1 Tax=Ptychodera flava TaxID=63121 RepID=UPI00396A63A6